MSTPSGGAPPSDSKDVDRRRSLGKYVKRMSSVFKREKPSKSGTSAAAAPPATAEEEGKEAKATPAPAAASSPTPAPVSAIPAIPIPAVPITQELNRSALQQERARALFAKYGLTLESHEWITTTSQPISVQRVEKPIRMRVHRNCHHCGTTFGADKACTNCEHKRCKKCPRYPKKKTPVEKGKPGDEGEGEAPQKRKKLLTIKTRHGEERVYQPPKQRVRRTCHKCDAFFLPPTATVCDKCHHVRCTKCPREPAKLDKWPNGYPGDAEAGSDAEVEADMAVAKRIWRKPRQRVRWECEACHSQFIEGSPRCPGCGHERCEKCTRMPIKRIKREPEFDPAVVRAVEEKLRALAVEEEESSSASVPVT